MESADRRKALWIELAVVFLWLVVPALINQLLTYSSHSTPNSRELYRFVQMVTELGTIAALAFIIWRSGDSFSSFGIIKDRLWRIVAITVVLLYLSVVISIATTPGHSIGQVTMEALGRKSLLGWLSTASLAAAAATMEELLYRSYLITRLQELLGSTEWAILISILVFGSVHIFRGGLHGFIGTGVFGLVQAIMFVRTRSLIPLAAAHTLHNLWLEWAAISL